MGIVSTTEVRNDYISRHCYGIYVEELMPTKENLSHDSWYPRQYSNLAQPEYEARIFTITL
jgi:hypothetical protein